MDDERADRPLLRGDHVLVVPAAVPEPRLAGEELRVVLRVVVHHEEDFPLDVDVLVVVPLELGSDDPVADEDELGARNVRLRLLRSGERHVVVDPGEFGLLAPLHHGRLLRHVAHDSDEGHLLDPSAAGCAGLETESLHLRLDVLLGEHLAARGGGAPLQEIRGEEADVTAEHVLGDRLRRLLFGRGNQRGRGSGGLRQSRDQQEDRELCSWMSSFLLPVFRFPFSGSADNSNLPWASKTPHFGAASPSASASAGASRRAARPARRTSRGPRTPA